MYFVVLEINDKLNSSTWQDLFKPWRLTTFDQPQIVHKFIER